MRSATRVFISNTAKPGLARIYSVTLMDLNENYVYLRYVLHYKVTYHGY